MLSVYYRKTYNFIKKMNVKNKPISMFTTIFILFKSTIFDIILRFFIRNIDIYKIRKKVIRNIIVINRFLYFIYNFVKKTKRINVKIQKLAKKENKSNELLFYKSFMEKFLSR